MTLRPATKTVLAYIAAVPTIAVIAFVVLSAVFETREAHSEDVDTLRLERREAIQMQERAHEREYLRVLCELEALRKNDNRVCR